jgi:hypothetical protein
MKTSRMTDYDRRVRREKIMEKRGNMILQLRSSRVQYHTTRFDVHCGKRQRARYARQLAAGQLNLMVITPPAPVAPAKPKRTRKAVA